MPAYHSAFLEMQPEPAVVGNMAMLPLRTRTGSRLTAPSASTSDLPENIVDEALSLYRANCLYRNFEIRGPADRTLIFATLIIGEMLTRVPARGTRDEVARALHNVAVGSFALPGEPKFPLNSIFVTPVSRGESESMRNYVLQLRIDLADALTECLFPATPLPNSASSSSNDVPSKWWMSFSKRKFMNKAL